MKKEPMTCQKALKITHILFFGGLILMIGGSLFLGTVVNSETVMVVFGVIGLIAAFAGIIFGFAYVKCPECGGSLMAGGRIPGSLPKYCPHCGKPL